MECKGIIARYRVVTFYDGYKYQKVESYRILKKRACIRCEHCNEIHALISKTSSTVNKWPTNEKLRDKDIVSLYIIFGTIVARKVK